MRFVFRPNNNSVTCTSACRNSTERDDLSALCEMGEKSFENMPSAPPAVYAANYVCSYQVTDSKKNIVNRTQQHIRTHNVQTSAHIVRAQHQKKSEVEKNKTQMQLKMMFVNNVGNVILCFLFNLFCFNLHVSANVLLFMSMMRHFCHQYCLNMFIQQQQNGFNVPVCSLTCRIDVVTHSLYIYVYGSYMSFECLFFDISFLRWENFRKVAI